MNKIKTTSTKVKTAIVRAFNLFWIVAIAGLGLYVMDFISFPAYIVKVYGIALLLTAAFMLYKSSK